MAEKNIYDSEFVICVQKSDPINILHIIIHPVLLVVNKEGEPAVSPESVIEQFKLIGSFQNSRIVAISRKQVSKKYWELLKEGVNDSETRDLGVQIDAEVLYS